MLERSLAVLRWQENALRDEYIPARRIWLDDEKLNEFFAWVKKDNEARMKGDKKDIEDPVENAAAENLIVG